MPRTRSKGAPAASKSSGAASSTSSRYILAPETDHPSKLFILPKKATPEARVVSLPHPRYSKPTRYLVCPETGIYEFTRVSAPKASPRSWLIEGCPSESAPDGKRFDAQVSKSADIYIASQIDPLFLILPSLAAQSPANANLPKRMFVTSDDHFDSLPQEDTHLSEILRWGKIRSLLESRMAVVCDTVEAGDETVFRLNEEKLIGELLAKAQRMSADGLPKSMEEKFFTKELEAPVMSIKSTATTTTTMLNVSTPQTDSTDSLSSISTADTAASFLSEASTAATSVGVGEDPADGGGEVAAAIEASQEVLKLQRLKTAVEFISSSYLPPALAVLLRQHLESWKDVDFTPLHSYTAQLKKLRQEATLARSASDFSRKRSWDGDDDEWTEKKRRKEEEEKRKKAGESRGVRDLKKVNVKGMKKMSDFFKKA